MPERGRLCRGLPGDQMAGEMRTDRRNGIRIHGKEGARQWLLPCAFLLFFGVLWYVSPIGIYPDSGSYISLQSGREPLYPLFLAFFRMVFREADTIVWLAASGQLESEKAMQLINTWPALRVAMFIQSMAAAAACWYLTSAVRKVFALNGPFTILTGLCSLIPYVLTPLASSSHMVLNKAVLTEGLAFPMAFVFAGCMIQGLLLPQRKGRYYGAALFWSLLLVLTRNQMLVTLAVWLAVVCFEIVKSRRWKLVVLPFLCLVVFLGVRTLCSRFYGTLAHEGYQGASTGSYNILTTLLYLADEEDAALIGDTALRGLFQEMHGQLEEQGMTRADAPDGILYRAYHYEEFYDRIGFDIQQPCLFGYVREQGISDGQALNAVIEVSTRMDRDLFPGLTGAYLSNYLATVISGLTRSVAASGLIMGVYAAFIYSLAACLMLYLFKKDRQSKAALLMLFALLTIFANVFATALMIMCLSRYMIYYTALFYIAGLMCLWELWRNQRRKC